MAFVVQQALEAAKAHRDHKALLAAIEFAIGLEAWQCRDFLLAFVGGDERYVRSEYREFTGEML